MALVYRTAGAWGPGIGQNLSAAQVDGNFRHLDQRMTGLEDDPPQAVSISNITATAATMTVHLTDGSTIGPLLLPVAAFYVHGDWLPNTPYAVNDVLRYGNASYMVRVEHTSAATFDANRVIAGETVYQLMTYGFEFRGEWHHDTQYRAYDFVRDFEGSVYIVRQSHFSAPVFDPDATTASNEPLYELVFARYVPPAQQVTIGASASGKPSNGQVILIPITRALTLAADAAGSLASADVAATAETDIAIRKNGTSIGIVRFAPAGTTASFIGVGTTSFVAGDRLSFEFPASADETLADVGIALLFTGN
jgi:hypothetical protein